MLLIFVTLKVFQGKSPSIKKSGVLKWQSVILFTGISKMT